jgi:hypothetical protein
LFEEISTIPVKSLPPVKERIFAEDANSKLVSKVY